MFLLEASQEARGRGFSGFLRRALRPSLLWLLLPLVVYLGWNVRLYQITGRPDAYAYAQRTVWNREVVAPWTGMTNSFELYGVYHDPTMIVEFVATLVILGLAVAVGLRRMWPELALVGSSCLVLMSSLIWRAASGALPCSSRSGCSWGSGRHGSSRRAQGLSWVAIALMLCGLGLLWCELLIANGVFVI